MSSNVEFQKCHPSLREFIPWGATVGEFADVHRGSTLITRVITFNKRFLNEVYVFPINIAIFY